MKIDGDSKVISSAFIKARGEMAATVIKDAKGNYGRYATLAALVEATTAPLAKHGLAIVQEASADEHGVCVETWLVHESGATMQFTPLTMPLADRKPQAVGSAITYARRYALGAICGLAPDDDDADAAQGAPKRQAKTAAPIEDDVIFDKPAPEVLSQAQMIRLQELGKTLYGPQEWEVQRPKLVQAVSKGAITSSKELTPGEADKLIAGIEKKLKEVAQQPIATVA